MLCASLAITPEFTIGWEELCLSALSLSLDPELSAMQYALVVIEV